MDFKEKELGLGNINGGAAYLVFKRCLKDVMANIRDVNTSEKFKRKITLEFEFTPFADRSGSNVCITPKTKLAARLIEPTQISIRKEGDELKAYSIGEHPDLFNEYQELKREELENLAEKMIEKKGGQDD